MYQIELDSQPIALCQLLKIANLVGGGGEAKIVISEGYVLVNDNVCLLKRKKIYHGDVIEFNGEIFEVICHQAVEQAPFKQNNKLKSSKATNLPAKGSKPKASNKKLTKETPTPATNKQGRRPISF